MSDDPGARWAVLCDGEVWYTSEFESLALLEAEVQRALRPGCRVAVEAAGPGPPVRRGKVVPGVGPRRPGEGLAEFAARVARHADAVGR